MKKTSALVLAAFVLLPAAAYAQQELAPQQQNQQLTGGVHVNDYGTSAVRIDRSTLRSGVTSTDFSPTLLPQQPQYAPLLDSRAFQGNVTDMKKVAPLLHSTATASGAAPSTPQVGAPYVWYQSAYGGYYDGSGTTKELVRADRLYLFGGKFADGTPVPKEPIRDFNAMGHAFRQQTLPTQAFWSHF